MAKMLEYRMGRIAYLMAFTIGIAALRIFIINPAIDQYVRPIIIGL